MKNTIHFWIRLLVCSYPLTLPPYAFADRGADQSPTGKIFSSHIFRDGITELFWSDPEIDRALSKQALQMYASPAVESEVVRIAIAPIEIAKTTFLELKKPTKRIVGQDREKFKDEYLQFLLLQDQIESNLKNFRERALLNFRQTEVLDHQASSQRIEKLSKLFLQNLQRANKLRQQEKSLDPRRERKIRLHVEQAFEAYGQAIFQAYKTKWSKRALRKYILSHQDRFPGILKPENMAAILATVGIERMLSNEIVINALAGGLTLLIFPEPIAVGAATLTASTIVRKALESPTVRPALSAIVGFSLKPLIRSAIVKMWKDKNGTPDVPYAELASEFWRLPRNLKYPVPQDAMENGNFVLQLLQPVLNGKNESVSLCEVLLLAEI